MRRIREFWSNFENISRDNCATVARLSRDIRESVSRLSHECSLFLFSFVRQSRDIRESVARYSYVCRFVLFFSPDSREVFACFLKTVARPSHDTRMTFVASVSRILHCLFVKNSRRQVRDTRTNVARPSHDSRATVLRNSLEKKFANDF